MTKTIVLRSLRGTGEPLQSDSIIRENGKPMTLSAAGQPSNMMDDITNACADLGVAHYPVNYHASIAPAGGMKTFQESYHDGWRKALLHDAEGQPSIWIGYSLGALILGDLLSASELANCVGAILISDPLRHPGQIDNLGVSRKDFGVAGSRWIPNMMQPVYSFSAPDDPISSLPAGNGMRQIASIVTGIPQTWQMGYLDMAVTMNAIQRYLGTPSIAGHAGKLSRHVCYGIEKAPDSDKTYTKLAADAAVKMINDYRENNA